MSNALPRVTYSNIGVDLTPVHDHLDVEIPRFKTQVARPALVQCHRGSP